MNKYVTIQVENNKEGVNGYFTNVLFYTITNKGDDLILRIVFAVTFSNPWSFDDSDPLDTIEIPITNAKCVMVMPR